MSTFVDQFGRPIDRSMLHEPQTAAIRALENQYLTPMLDGLSPPRLCGPLTPAI